MVTVNRLLQKIGMGRKMKIKALEAWNGELNKRLEGLAALENMEMLIRSGARPRAFDDKEKDPKKIRIAIQQLQEEIAKINYLIDDTDIKYTKNDKIGIV